jgi:GH43 family beta-xylosidase
MTIYNPILPQGQDPYIYYHDGWYYHIFVEKPFGWCPIQLRKSRSIQTLSGSSVVDVWVPPHRGDASKHLWAPEIHYVRNRWYIYFSAVDDTMTPHGVYVLESVGSDPQGEYRMKGKITKHGYWAIDGTVLTKTNGESYFIWSGIEKADMTHVEDGMYGGDQRLYASKMLNPWTLTGDAVCISSPEFSWERQGGGINEGPQVLEKNGKYFIVYSASHSLTDEYCLGLLINESGDILNSTAWKKAPEPVFTKTEDVFGPGHASFLSTPEGRDWIIYHSAQHSGSGWERKVNAQPFIWTDNGTPHFGSPLLTVEF